MPSHCCRYIQKFKHGYDLRSWGLEEGVPFPWPTIQVSTHSHQVVCYQGGTIQVQAGTGTKQVLYRHNTGIYTLTRCMLPRRRWRWGSQHQVTQRPTVKLNDCSGHSAAYNSRGGRVQIHRKSNHPKLYFYQDQPLFTYLVHKKQNNDHQYSSFEDFLNSMSKSNFCSSHPSSGQK